MKSAILVAVCAGLSAHATTVISVTGAPTFGTPAGQQQNLTAGFTTGKDNTNLPTLASPGGIPTESARTDLALRSGARATAAQETANPGIGGVGPRFVPVFGALSLAMGTHYLTQVQELASTDGWNHSTMATVNTAYGASLVFDGYYYGGNFTGVAIPGYVPGASFATFVTFDNPPDASVQALAIPEPATGMLALLAILGLSLAAAARRLTGNLLLDRQSAA